MDGESTSREVAEMRAIAREAALNNGRGKHDDPEFYSRNLAILLVLACDRIDALVRVAEQVKT